MKRLLAAASSLRVAILLIGYLAAACVLATLVPQGRAGSFYEAAYGRALAGAIAATGFSSFFSSPAFVLPAFLLFANLAACSTRRLVGELRGTRPRRFGPDVVHFGLMLLFVSALLSGASRQTGYVDLAEGDSVRLPDGSVLTLTRFEFLRYDDGRPRDWISTIRLDKGGATVLDGFRLRVNHPLRIGPLTIYQTNHSVDRGRDLSGLEAVRDPFVPAVIASLAVVAAGLSACFVGRAREKAA